jgi:hypothetical protein
MHKELSSRHTLIGSEATISLFVGKCVEPEVEMDTNMLEKSAIVQSSHLKKSATSHRLTMVEDYLIVCLAH